MPTGIYNRLKPMSEKTKEKIREFRKKYKHSEITKKKLREAYNLNPKMGFKKGHNGRLGKPHSEETKQKIRIKLSGRKRSLEIRNKMSEIFKQSYKNGTKISWNKGKKNSQEANEKNRLSQLRIHTRIMDEIKNLTKQGYRCIPVGGRVRPDIIAIKNNKVFAIEVEYGKPNYGKYDNEMKSFVDDIIWIIK